MHFHCARIKHGACVYGARARLNRQKYSAEGLKARLENVPGTEAENGKKIHCARQNSFFTHGTTRRDVYSCVQFGTCSERNELKRDESLIPLPPLSRAFPQLTLRCTVLSLLSRSPLPPGIIRCSCAKSKPTGPESKTGIYSHWLVHEKCSASV